MAGSSLTEAEGTFLAELEVRSVEYMIVGLTAATLQGANTAPGSLSRSSESPTTFAVSFGFDSWLWLHGNRRPGGKIRAS
jgi:hypothetical protein